MKNKPISIIVGIFILLALSSCAVNPTVELSKLTKPEDKIDNYIDSYFLRKSFIKIDQGTSDDSKNKLQIETYPSEHTDFKIGIKRADSFGTKTNINFVKILFLYPFHFGLPWLFARTFGPVPFHFGDVEKAQAHQKDFRPCNHNSESQNARNRSNHDLLEIGQLIF